MVGRTIGPYRILAKLGEGGMGTVWKAQHIELPDRVVALKLLAEHLWSSDEARQRFRREAMAVSRLDHPGIATLYHAEQADDRFYIAFKFIDGDTVARQCEAGPLLLSEAVAVATDAAQALAHAHARGVLHRDVTAGNIMIDREGRGVVVDFGLARGVADVTLTRTDTTQGTLPYMAPEVVRGEPAEARSDLYGLGVVLYRMVTGHLPFEAGPAESMTYQILNQSPAAPSALRPSIPSELDDLVLRLLEKAPEDRYASAEELVTELRRLQSLPAIQAEITTAVPIRGDALRRWLFALRRLLRNRAGRRALVAAAGLVALAGGVGIAWKLGWLPAPRPRTTTLAVLPLRNTSPDSAETAYLAEGLGEELVSRLGQVSGLRLVPWMTSQRFGDPSQTPAKIARKLGVDALVMGSYRSDGERLQVTMSLVNRRGLQRWSQVYEERLEDLFTVQRDLALGVASQLKRVLAAPEQEKLAQAPSQNPEAYEFFLHGAEYLHTEDPQTISRAEFFFEKALGLDPKLAEAWVGLGAVHADRYFRGVAGDAELAESERCFLRALEIHPGLAAAERGLVNVYVERGRKEEGLKLGAAAAKRAPDDAEALLVQGWAYSYCGLPSKALPVLARVLDLDPANQPAAWYRVFTAVWSGRFEDAVNYGKSYIREFDEDPEVYTWLGEAWRCRGDLREARLCYERALELFGEERSNLYVVPMAIGLYLQIGEAQRARALAFKWVEILERRLAAYPDNWRVQLPLVAMYAVLGRKHDVERWAGQWMVDARAGRFTGEGLGSTVGALLQVGSLDLAREAYRLTFDPRSPIGEQDLILCPSDAPNPFDSEPEFVSLRADKRRRLDELAAKY